MPSTRYDERMVERSFHHGNLRAALLDEAMVVLRESGIDGLSLRDLARRTGVSHGAPRSHFVDRQALLDGVAVLGFERLAATVRHELGAVPGLRDRFRAVARAYVDFAIDDAALMELMFQVKVGEARSAEVDAAAGAMFSVLDGAIGDRPSHDGEGDRTAFKLLFSATMQGLAGLVAARRVDREHGARLIDAAVDMMLTSDLGTRTVTATDGPGAP